MGRPRVAVVQCTHSATDNCHMSIEEADLSSPVVEIGERRGFVATAARKFIDTHLIAALANSKA